MNRVEAPQRDGPELGGPVEELVVEPDEVDASQQVSRAPHGLWTVRPHSPNDFHPRERRRDPYGPSAKKPPEVVGFSLGNDQFYEGR